MKYALSLGTSEGEKYLSDAIDELKAGGKILKLSLIYETAPVETTCKKNFLNMCILYETDKNPFELLSFTQRIEKKLGRVNKGDKGCRTIDIDILLLEDTIVFARDLRIPHPGLYRRAFYLVPLNEIAGEWIDPLTGKSVEKILNDLKETGGVWKTGTL